MKRDYGLIREVLLKLEELTPGETYEATKLGMEYEDEREFVYNIGLMIDAGLLEGEVVHSVVTRFQDAFILSVRWEGQEYLDTVRDPAVWSETKRRLGRFAAEVPIDVLKQTAVAALTGFLS